MTTPPETHIAAPTTPAPQQQTTNVMLDIETYGNTPGSVIKSIGAVKFEINERWDDRFSTSHRILDRIYGRIDLASSIAAGLKMDGDTVEWWMSQSDEARKEITLPGKNLAVILYDLEHFIGNEAFVWGNGAAYDNVLVASAYEAIGLKASWAHKRSLCYRTIKNANRDIPIDAYRVRTAHNALDDAESQALHLMAIWERDAKRVKAWETLRIIKIEAINNNYTESSDVIIGLCNSVLD